MLQSRYYARFKASCIESLEPLCLEYTQITISNCLNPVGVTFLTIIATIQTMKALPLLPLHLISLTLHGPGRRPRRVGPSRRPVISLCNACIAEARAEATESKHGGH